jgi:hypothetical protein
MMNMGYDDLDADEKTSITDYILFGIPALVVLLLCAVFIKVAL